MHYRAKTGFFSLILLAVASASVAGTWESQVEQLLAQDEPPPGVVFEIVTGNEDALRSRLPEAARQAERLRRKFPKLDIAVVTHGRELFALMEVEQDAYAEVHDQVRSLTGDQDIPVYVCGRHAAWRGKVPEDFPDYVEVAAEGPATIEDYRKLGYIIILL